MRTLRVASAFLLAPLAAWPVAGFLFSSYLSLDDEPFRLDEFLRGALTFGFAVTLMAYMATLLFGAATLWYVRRRGVIPSLSFIVAIGALGGAVLTESYPWVQLLQGELWSPLFFVYTLLGALSGAVVAAAFWAIALRPDRRIRTA